jgi:hypothetical protein
MQINPISAREMGDLSGYFGGIAKKSNGYRKPHKLYFFINFSKTAGLKKLFSPSSCIFAIMSHDKN